ncbi:hypothetical protein HHK36_027353 [Tetracentron sinense]|uniref:HMA domain-containing protein n=1 Tax=Tetracentron sinense TaxID=13715 RepID=A0A835D4C5_TETSI|nr:hypothetical protein HHK36_027353 [Tetracentron sinense]
MPKSRPLSLQTVELKVRMCCNGCERVVKNAILKLRGTYILPYKIPNNKQIYRYLTMIYIKILQGVDSVEVDLEMEKVTVIGYIDRNKVLKAVRRSGKRGEFWPHPNPPLYFTSANNYFKDMTNDYKESYNYWRHGYNVGDNHGTLPATRRGDDKVSNLFNDDNVNACCLM